MHSPTRQSGVAAWIGRKALFAAETLHGVLTIVTASSPLPRWRLARTYLWIRSREFLDWLLPLHLQRERFFGMEFRFFRYHIFSLLYREIFVERDYEFEADTGRAPRIIDCGANCGMSIAYFKLRYPDAEIVAFEPSGVVHALLLENIERNALTGVTVHKVAVSDREGTVDFFLDEEVLGSIYVARGHGAAGATERVPTAPLSRYIDGDVDFLKMDIEGAEVTVLPELVQSGAIRHVRRMVIEYHHHLDATRDNLSEILSLLETAGFGYQLKTNGRFFAPDAAFQDILISCYRRDVATSAARAARSEQHESALISTT